MTLRISHRRVFPILPPPSPSRWHRKWKWKSSAAENQGNSFSLMGWLKCIWGAVSQPDGSPEAGGLWNWVHCVRRCARAACALLGVTVSDTAFKCVTHRNMYSVSRKGNYFWSPACVIDSSGQKDAARLLHQNIPSFVRRLTCIAQQLAATKNFDWTSDIPWVLIQRTAPGLLTLRITPPNRSHDWCCI